MTWFKVDDSLAFHAKVVQAGNAAMGLWVRAGSWSAQQLTDGHVPSHIVSALGNKKQAERLVSVGLWVALPDGYAFHQWNEDGRQPTRAQVEKDRGEARDRMRRAREARRVGSAEVQANSERTSAGVRVTRPDPSRPVLPTTQEKGGSHVSSGSASAPPLFPDHCERHADEPKPGKCGDCADARKANAIQAEQLPNYRLRVVPPLCGECDERWIETPSGLAKCPRCYPTEVRTARERRTTVNRPHDEETA